LIEMILLACSMKLGRNSINTLINLYRILEVLTEIERYLGTLAMLRQDWDVSTALYTTNAFLISQAAVLVINMNYQQ
jgi:hypothetical protein